VQHYNGNGQGIIPFNASHSGQKPSSVLSSFQGERMPNAKPLTRKQLIEYLNEDLAREYQAIIAYVNYSQVLKGAAYMNIADGTGRPRRRRARPRTQGRQRDRLPGRHADRAAEAS
jgi:hypothetical protein